jgi:predicted double-glycine peptidase
MWLPVLNYWRGLMFNLKFIFSPGSCGVFCLRYILKKKINRESYLSVFKIKEILNLEGYYCTCLKIKKLEYITKRCITLLENRKKEKHYVVVHKIIGEYVYFYDPLYVVIRKKKIDFFVKRWSGICLFYTKV